jgi:hypothetical protein
MAATSHGTTLSFDQMEVIIRQKIDPIIRRQFEQSQTAYHRVLDDRHPWAKPEGIESWMQLMRGELELPHAPARCGACRNAFEMQLEVARGKFPGLGRRGGLSLSSRRNDIRRMLRELAQEQAA